MNQTMSKSAKVLFGGTEVTLHVTDKSILFENDKGEITGIEKSAIRMIKTNSDGAVVVAYASGSEVKSVSIKPIQGDATSLLLLLGDKEHIPPVVFDEEFERMYQYWKNRLEDELKQSIEGKPYRLEREELDQVMRASEKMNDILKQKFRTKDVWSTRVWELRNLPEEYQIGWAKVQYISYFLPEIIWIASGWSVYTENEPVFNDIYDGMRADEWERLFLYYGIIDKPILTEELKEKIRKAEELYGAEIQTMGNPPPDYKSWF